MYYYYKNIDGHNYCKTPIKLNGVEWVEITEQEYKDSKKGN